MSWRPPRTTTPTRPYEWPSCGHCGTRTGSPGFAGTTTPFTSTSSPLPPHRRRAEPTADDQRSGSERLGRECCGAKQPRGSQQSSTAQPTRRGRLKDASRQRVRQPHLPRRLPPRRAHPAAWPVPGRAAHGHDLAVPPRPVRRHHRRPAGLRALYGAPLDPPLQPPGRRRAVRPTNPARAGPGLAVPGWPSTSGACSPAPRGGRSPGSTSDWAAPP
jgi:hypothetical protein